MATKIFSWVKQEIVFVISFLLALVSSIFVIKQGNSIDFFSAIDFRVISILFTLMLIIAGFQSLGVFSFLANKLCCKIKTLRSISLALILLCFFSSMLITNDVALITFVPFAILILKETKNLKFAPIVIVLQTIAANLGSILTPLGNPQNLFLYSKMQINIFEFLKILFPYCAFSFVLILVFNLFIPKEKIENLFSTNNLIYIPKENFKSILIFSILFFCSILTVLNIIPYQIVLFLVLIITLIINKNLFTKADYTLLLTFICFFIFTNNISNIESIKNFLVNLIHNKDFFISLITSQIISNVPAALLLQPFSTNLTELLLGVNIGGLGTLIASLASLISFKIYSKEKELKLKQFFITFTLLNIIFLILLILFHLVLKNF